MRGIHKDRSDGDFNRLRWLTFYRVIITSFLLGIAAFIQFVGTEFLTQTSLYLVYAIIGLTYVISIAYVLILKKWTSVAGNVYLQSLVDVVIVTALVYVTGGAGSIYQNLYSLVIIYAVLFLEKKGGILLASASGILYGLLLDLEYYGFIEPVYSAMYVYDFSAGYVFSRIFIHIVSFYIVALLASFVVGQERKTRRLLIEREDAFKRLDLLYRSIIESVNAGVVTVDRAQRIRSFNRVAEEITGVIRHQAIDRDIEDVFPDMLVAMERVEDGVGNFEYALTYKRYTPALLVFSLSPLMNPEGEPIGNILIFQDHTAIKAMEREIDKNKKMAFMGEMAAVLAHELRNPLASIGGSIQLLKRDLPLEEGDRKLMDIVLRGKDQLENLARDFLLFTRPAQGGDDTIDMSEVVEDILETLYFGSDWNRTVHISQALCDAYIIRGNRVEVRHALLNIVINALQAMHNGGTLSIRTQVRTDEKSGRKFLEISVVDQGCGIEETTLRKVREPFFTTKEMGTGLGLAIVSRVMEGHHGYFEIKSEVDQGTCCTMGFPL